MGVMVCDSFGWRYHAVRVGVSRLGGMGRWTCRQTDPDAGAEEGDLAHASVEQEVDTGSFGNLSDQLDQGVGVKGIKTERANAPTRGVPGHDMVAIALVQPNAGVGQVNRQACAG